MKTKLFIFFIIIASIAKQSYAQIITTVAGSGTAGYSGDGGQATVAELHNPWGISLDAGNIYIADYRNNRIRMINTSGVITTIAGNGTGGYSGDGGQATAAELRGPDDIKFDHLGNIYICDVINERIRKINTVGIISTIAGNGAGGFGGDGGLATAAMLNWPNGIAPDALGNLYIADTWNQCVRMVNTTGIIATIAGAALSGAGYSGDGGPATAAQLYYPTGVTLDATGNLYISDNSNNRIRMVNTAGIISTVVGTGVAGFSGDGGQATAAELNGPYNGIAFDALGNFYIPDYENNRIRKVNTLGIISTIAGNGIAGFSGDGGSAILAKLNGPSAVALDSSLCNLYITDVVNNRIRKVNFMATVMANPTAICSGATATLTASNANIYVWNTGASISTITASPASTSSYTFIGTNESCTTKVISTISVTTSPTVSINGNTIVCIGQNTMLTASGATRYIWNTNDTTSSIVLTPTITTSYTVMGSIGTCNNQAVATLSVNTSFDFTLPNIVTPNNDGINDYIDFGKYQFSSLQLDIYNRWGAKVYESMNPTCIWKPTEDDGTYFYTAQYQIDCGAETQNKTLKGFITLIK